MYDKKEILANYLCVDSNNITESVDDSCLFTNDVSNTYYEILDSVEIIQFANDWEQSIKDEYEPQLDKVVPGISYCIDWDAYFGDIDYYEMGDFEEYDYKDSVYYIREA